MSVAHTFLFAVGNSMTTWGKLSSLPGVARDIDSVFDALVEGGPGLGLANRVRSVKLLDKGAREVKERWEAFIEAVEIDALVVFYFAGHGALVGAHDLRLLLADSESSQKDETTLSVLQVIRMLENKGVAEWAVILDCCDSGEVTRDGAIQGARERKNRGSLIACATSFGSAWETPEHGARFTSCLTEAIRTGSCMQPGAEFVDIVRAATWAKDRLPEPRPLVDHWGSADFWVARILPTFVLAAAQPGALPPVVYAPPQPAPEALGPTSEEDRASHAVMPSQRPESSTPPRDLIEAFAEHYPDVGDARALWIRAGGRASDVENILRPRDLWQRLWLRSIHGAAVGPAKLLQTAIDESPHNSVFRQHLAAWTDQDT